MKKIFNLLLVIICFLTFTLSAYSTENKHWTYPTQIKTYIPQNHPRTEMMKRAFTRWTKLTNNKIVFKYVQNQKLAQIKVHFVDKIPNADREIGLTTLSHYTNGEINSAEIYIADKTSTGKILGNDSVFTVMLHEIGHSMGIIGHTNDPLSIMYPTENDAQEILKSDLTLLGKIYKW